MLTIYKDSAKVSVFPLSSAKIIATALESDCFNVQYALSSFAITERRTLQFLKGTSFLYSLKVL